jgi:hypothetical protein
VGRQALTPDCTERACSKCRGNITKLWLCEPLTPQIKRPVVAATIRLPSAQQRISMRVVIDDGSFVVTSPVPANANPSVKARISFFIVVHAGSYRGI